MEPTPAKSNKPNMRGTDDKERRTRAGKRFSGAGPLSAGVGSHEEIDAQEDWSSLATSDPAFWLKGIDH